MMGPRSWRLAAVIGAQVASASSAVAAQSSPPAAAPSAPWVTADAGASSPGSGSRAPPPAPVDPRASYFEPTGYRGGPVPSGWHLERWRSVPAVVGGALIFGLSYGVAIAFDAALVAPASVSGWGQTLVPVVGPIWWSVASSRLAPDPMYVALNGALAVMQAVGLTTLVIGAAVPRVMLVPDRAGATPGSSRSPRASFVPHVDATSATGGLRVEF